MYVVRLCILLVILVYFGNVYPVESVHLFVLIEVKGLALANVAGVHVELPALTLICAWLHVISHLLIYVM